METDIQEEREQHAVPEAGDEEVLVPLFDPKAFKDEHGDLKIVDYQLRDEELHEYAKVVT